jgi:hypothetical protein
VEWSGKSHLAFAHLAEGSANALLGLTGLTFFAATLTLHAFDRCQKSRCFWLAI